MQRKTFLFLALQLAWLMPQAQDAVKNTQPLSWQDIPSWHFNRMNTAQPSADGKWFAYISGPTEGDLSLTLKKTADSLHYTYKIGGQVSLIKFNNDSKYIGFFESPAFKDVKANEKARRPSSKKLRLVALKDTASVTFDKVQSFDFSNDNSQWLAIRFDALPASPMLPRPEDAGKGTDLLLYNMYSKKSFNLGNVSDYKFNKSGQYLAYTVDANGANGNGVFLMDLKTGLTTALQNDKATFAKITWNKEGNAFALVKSKKDKQFKSPVFTLIAVKNIQGSTADVFVYSGLDENQITAGYGISEFSNPYWSKDLNHIFFGVAKIEKNETPVNAEKKIDNLAKDSTLRKTSSLPDSVTLKIAAAKNGGVPDSIAGTKPNHNASIKANPAVNKKDLEKPDMIIWNWQDKRLQSMQRTQLQRDKNFNVMSVWNVSTNTFTSLADSSIKSIALSPDQSIGYGLDFTAYEYESSLDGQRYADVYLLDVKTGKRTLALKKLYLNALSSGLTFSPNGDNLLYYSDGAYFVLDTKTLVTTNISKNIPGSFIHPYTDTNVSKPGIPNFGFTSDGKYVLLKDNYDLWKVATDGKSFSALTGNWKDQQIMALYPNKIYEDDDFIDLKKDQYFTIFNDKNKQKGVAILPANAKTLQIVKLDDINISPINKVKNAAAFFYTQESSVQEPAYYISTDRFLKNESKLTPAQQENEKYTLSAGVKLLTYVSAHGDTLQATLYLPANYVEGQAYPTITYIYERLTQDKNSYSQPAFPGGGFNRALYTSNGYAVLMPDIKYKLNDPGLSAVACVVPAVKAAIATGIVDAKNVAIHGHSWGGYQTSFLITQTDIFKAAVAGAPLTNMISMYSLIYWNSGSTNQSIFESSQGRLTTGYWDNWDAYVRNSPIYHIKKVNTPLVILHNDKDGAVDYTQGIEYFNGLRRLNKPVVMLTYNGENHGLMKEVNRKDYAVRMMEYFDHYLKGKPAPSWWSKGIDYIDMEKHLEERAF